MQFLLDNLEGFVSAIALVVSIIGAGISRYLTKKDMLKEQRADFNKEIYYTFFEIIFEFLELSSPEFVDDIYDSVLDEYQFDSEDSQMARIDKAYVGISKRKLKLRLHIIKMETYASSDMNRIEDVLEQVKEINSNYCKLLDTYAEELKLAFDDNKGIIMNLQQIKATAEDIGDGGEDITTESLSKYEAASKALGVSLKEVKNGVLQLRDPMEVLRELSIAVRQESEGSIKVANLISAVGGKFRGNQLIALLQNWDTYEKMLSEFNSDNAIGSAMEEAEKSANNWNGSINQLKNSWAELTSQFINSDNAIETIQTLNKIIPNITNSAATGTLKNLADGIVNLIKLIGTLTDKVGALPLIVAGITTAKGKGKPNRICLFTHRCIFCA